jgi:uncharacterized protein YjbI with pentapeptide repeats
MTKGARMKSFSLLPLLLIVFVIFPSSSPASAENKAGKEWSGTLRDGRVIHGDDLKKLLEDHDKWVRSFYTKGKKADLSGANLSDADLHGVDLIRAELQGAYLPRANLQGANLSNADLQGTDLTDADLQRADLTKSNLQEAGLGRANLQGASLDRTNLQRADLSSANLQGAYLAGANLQGANLLYGRLQGANLTNADLQGVNLTHANLKGAYLAGADFEATRFEIEPGTFPDIPSIALARNLSLLKYVYLPNALVELRNKFKEYGLRKQEREITYAIKRSGYEYVVSYTRDFKTRAEVEAGRILFNVTCKWGMEPERPLFILVFLIGLFSIPYAVSISMRRKTDGIWQSWSPGRIRKDLGSDSPQLISSRGLKIILVAVYFSILSAFNIGWRDLNVGNWISRIQPREYTLHATGWVRCVSGIQSLISVYLLVLWFLTYFGRPFESY